MSQTDKMLSRKEGKVGYLTFNNPERHNAVSLEMWEAASGLLEDFKNDKNIRVVVVTGAGGKAFISGADISKFEKERSTQEGVDRYNAAVDHANNAFYTFSWWQSNANQYQEINVQHSKGLIRRPN